jgi:hypothetical protein
LPRGSRLPRSRSLATGRTGCNHRTPRPAPARLWITCPTGCNSCTRAGNGVQPALPRGATDAATGCSSCTRTVQGTIHGTVRRPRACARGARRRVARRRAHRRVLRRLEDAWILTPAQRARLVPAVEAALSSGWSPAELAAFTGANVSGVRNPFAVLAARLSPAGLPARTQPSPPRPPWCGDCAERTRRREDGTGADAGRCPACHPLAPWPVRVRPRNQHPDRLHQARKLPRCPTREAVMIWRCARNAAGRQDRGLVVMILSESARITGPGSGWWRGWGEVADRSAIEWTTATRNPATGCDRFSAGCGHCYALALHRAAVRAGLLPLKHAATARAAATRTARMRLNSAGHATDGGI